MTCRVTKFVILGFLVVVAPAASADVVFSDFASTSPRFEMSVGSSIGPLGGGGANFAQAASFTPTATYTFTSLEIALFSGSSTNADTLAVRLTSDSGSATPGSTVYASFDVAPGTLNNSGLVLTFNASGPPVTLTASTPYWVTVTDVTSHGSDGDAWNNNNTSYVGTKADSLNGGTTWTSFPDAPGAFEIDGNLQSATVVPEPATSTMAIAGALAFLAVHWRRRHKAGPLGA